MEGHRRWIKKMPKGKGASVCPRRVCEGGANWGQQRSNHLTKYPPWTEALSTKHVRNLLPLRAQRLCFSTYFNRYLLSSNNPAFTVTLVLSCMRNYFFHCRSHDSPHSWQKIIYSEQRKNKQFQGKGGQLSVGDQCASKMQLLKLQKVLLGQLISCGRHGFHRVPCACEMSRPGGRAFLKAEACMEPLK